MARGLGTAPFSRWPGGRPFPTLACQATSEQIATCTHPFRALRRWERLKVLSTEEGSTPDEGFVTFQTWFKVRKQIGQRQKGSHTQTFVERSRCATSAGRLLLMPLLPGLGKPRPLPQPRSPGPTGSLLCPAADSYGTTGGGCMLTETRTGPRAASDRRRLVGALCSARSWCTVRSMIALHGQPTVTPPSAQNTLPAAQHVQGAACR